MKRILAIALLSAAASSFAHETDNYHWINISETNGGSTYVNQEGLKNRRKTGVWIKQENNVSGYPIERYIHFKTNCKGSNPVFQDEFRIISRLQNLENKNKNIVNISDPDIVKLVRTIICSDY